MNEANVNPIPPPPPYPAPAPPAALPPQPMMPAAPPAVFANPLTFRKSPGLAGFLSLFAGAGHIYLGLYQRAVIFFAIWVMSFVLTAQIGFPFGFMIPFWTLFVVIDAVRQAHAINATGAPESNIVTGEVLNRAGGMLGVGIFFILIGLFLLVDRFVVIDLSFLRDWWPLLLVFFGAWQVFSYYKAKTAAGAAAAGTDIP